MTKKEVEQLREDLKRTTASSGIVWLEICRKLQFVDNNSLWKKWTINGEPFRAFSHYLREELRIDAARVKKTFMAMRVISECCLKDKEAVAIGLCRLGIVASLPQKDAYKIALKSARDDTWQQFRSYMSSLKQDLIHGTELDEAAKKAFAQTRKLTREVRRKILFSSVHQAEQVLGSLEQVKKINGFSTDGEALSLVIGTWLSQNVAKKHKAA